MLSLKTVQERVSMLFYHHGLLCASHPFAIISLVITIVMFMCYPLMNMPLPGNAPLQFVTPVEGYKLPPSLSLTEIREKTDGDVKIPRWYFGAPVGYIQQVVVRAGALPLDAHRSVASDAVAKATLSSVFDVIEHVENFQLHNASEVASLSDACLHVAEVTSNSGHVSLLPTYNCLHLSPARFWNHDKQRFMTDPSVVKTISKQQETTSLFKEILFGVPWKHTGLKKNSRHGSPQVITYAVTIVFRHYHHTFVAGLRDHLQSLYSHSSSSANTSSSSSSSVSQMTHIHYRSHNYIVEYTPLMLAYIVLCLYLYFSVRKIEMVKSKWGLALSAMITVFASLLMSVSLCVFFGLTPSLSGSEIFPYLVVVIGLENVLVVTKSVVSTPVHLDVKLRVAQGLQKEGWYIFRHLMTELLVLAVGFFTFVPAIQEFCLFAVLGLGSDFFLQMFFFTTVLSIDIRRMELSDLQSSEVQAAMRRDSYQLHITNSLTSSSSSHHDHHHCPVMSRLYTPVDGDARVFRGDDIGISPVRTRRLPAVAELMDCGDSGAVYDDVFCDHVDVDQRQRRLLHVWAQYRIAQRGIMLCVVVWILLLVYKTGLVEQIDDLRPVSSLDSAAHDTAGKGRPDEASWLMKDTVDASSGSVGGGSGSHENQEELWKSLSPNHWPTLFAYYNISLIGRYLTVLPSVHLSLPVSVDSAATVDHHGDVDRSHDVYLRTANASRLLNQSSLLTIILSRLVRTPRTNMELVLTILLAIASVILAVNGLLTMYKCMCSRNYARWRSSWQRRRHVRRRWRGDAAGYYIEFRETVPLVLSGHKQDVECIVFDGQYVVSSCLAGEIRVWDSSTGECLTTIDRSLPDRDRLGSADTDHSPIMSTLKSPCLSLTPDTPMSSGFNSPLSVSATDMQCRGSSVNSLSSVDVDDKRKRSSSSHGHTRHRSVDFALADIIPDLSETIDTDFLHAARKKLSSGSHNGYDFTEFQTYFDEHRRLRVEEQLCELRRCTLPATCAASVSNLSADFVSTATSPCHAAVTNNSECVMVESESISQMIGSAVWCLTCHNDVVIAGCRNGSIELWDAVTGRLQGCYHIKKAGVISVCVYKPHHIIAARVSGVIEFLQLSTAALQTDERLSQGQVVGLSPSVSDVPPPSLSLSASDCCRHHESLSTSSSQRYRRRDQQSMHCCLLLLYSVRAHQQAVNVMRCHGDRVVTASNDHTLKVYRTQDAMCLYTLHGHSAAVTALTLYQCGRLAASGSEDASVRLWDLESGCCRHKLTAHSATVTSICLTATHVVSVAIDDRLCIWHSNSGSLLHCIQLEPGYCNTVAVLTRHIIATGGQGCVYIWDTEKGSLLRGVSLSDEDNSQFVRQLHVSADSSPVVVTDYGCQLRLVRFTSVLEKDD